MTSRYLIKGGRVLIFDHDKNTSFPQLDILVQDQRITKIGPNLSLDNLQSVEVVDASDHIVTPGFIDGHRHVFQSQLRSTVSNHTLLEYCAHLLQGRMVFLDAQDMYLSQLSGCTEAIYSGVTTVMDHSHAVTTLDRARQCIKATLESGIRSVYCAAPFAIPVSLNPLTLPDMSVQHAKQIDMIKQLATDRPLGGAAANDGRVRLGLGFDTMHHIPQEVSREILTFAKKNDLPTTMHDVPRYNLPALNYLRDNDMPLPKVTLSHTCDPGAEEIRWVKQHDIGIVCTPESEMAMSHGHPSGLDFHQSDCRAGLGVDSPAICSGDPFFTMRLALQEKRVRENAKYHACGKLPDLVPAKTDQVLYMATLGGAAAIHMESEIGSLEAGKFADIVLIRTDTPSMVSVVDYSAALVTHCMASDVSSVMINGEWVKRDGRLLRVNWDELKGHLKENRAVLEKRWEGVDWERNKSDLKDLWQIRGVME
jgi:cytosine/adenosine deaminase-related metal-dependent hydrolase